MSYAHPLSGDHRVSTMGAAAAAFLSAAETVHHAVRDVAGCGLALLIRQLRQRHQAPIVVIVPTEAAARLLLSDLRFVLEYNAEAYTHLLYAPVVPLNGPTLRPYAQQLPDRRAAQERLAGLLRMHPLKRTHEGGTLTLPRAEVVVVSAHQLLRKVPNWQQLDNHTELLRLGQTVDRDALIKRLTQRGYLRAPLVEDPCTLAARGALLDIWPPGVSKPLRIELDGEDIVSIKHFNTDNQRSISECDQLWLPAARPAPLDDPTRAEASRRLREICDQIDHPSSKTRALIDDVTLGRSFFGAAGFAPATTTLHPLIEQLPEDALVLVEEPSAIVEQLRALAEQLAEDELHAADTPHFALSELAIEPDDIDRWLSQRKVLAINNAAVLGQQGVLGQLANRDNAPAGGEQPASLACHDQRALVRDITLARSSEGQGAGLDPLVDAIAQWRDAGLQVILSARTATQAERLSTMLGHREVAIETRIEQVTLGELAPRPTTRPDGGAMVVVSSLARGAVCPTEQLALVTEEEIFGRRAAKRKATKKNSPQRALEDLRTLAVGDFVVHVEHGVGRYEGLVHRRLGANLVDLLSVSYSGGDKLYLPVYRLNQIHKYRGSDAKPRLDKLGGQSFARTKKRTAKKVRDMADELLRLYAERKAAKGFATPPIDDDYRAFEAAFPYEETRDQLHAIDDVAADLEAEQPMDRLVCGDVGFGKTEVALRAAFRVAMSGRQVALLCPTTVLAQQHKLTFDVRLAGYPLEVAVLSRFQSKKQQNETVRKLRRGTVDVVIGTHRLLSKDVHFARLGLLVVDEEQRFGVAAKERIKALRTNIDVLTLSATPIPRTLQLAVSGARDLSLITTAPIGRRAVRTIVTRHDPNLLREALTRELARGGQAFYVYNRITGLEERGAMLAQLLPDARIAIAHGQMRESALERTMVQFVAGEFDILCTTAIIENGLDIPRCNTIIIDRADMFGLSQLYQLRGRVGRATERGYCYLVLPPGGSVGKDAQARIEALQRYTELGSGFQIASLDLDLRGGGDLLGAEQSGAIAAVGFEMFCRMLDEAVQLLRGDTVIQEVDPELSFDVEALLPNSYIDEVGVRLSLYKRLADAQNAAEVQALSEEMQDRFGTPPPPARRYVQLMTLKTALRKLRVLACEASHRAVTLHLRDDTPINHSALTALLGRGGRRGAGSYKLTPDMRLTRRSGEGEVFESGLQACDRLVDELQRLTGQ